MAAKSVIVCVALVATACGGGQPALREIQRVSAGTVDVALLSPDGTIAKGEDTVTIEFRTNESLVDVGTVTASATMPMAGMAPMAGQVRLVPTDTTGRYEATVRLSMAGTWRVDLRWSGPSGAPAGAGAATLSADAQ
jgi:hypothetical protein